VSRILRAGTKVGYSDQLEGNGKASNQKGSYDRDNRVISPKSPYRRRSLPPQQGVYISRGVYKIGYMLEPPGIQRCLEIRNKTKVRTISREAFEAPQRLHANN